MQNLYHNFAWLFFILLVTVCPFNSASAQSNVKYSVSAKQTYVDQPIIVTLQISNADDYKLPEWPEIEGLTIRQQAPSTSTQMTFINGRTSRSSTITFQIIVLASKPGEYKIPELEFSVDGSPKRLPEIEFLVSDYESTNDVPGHLLHVEVTGEREEIYVGEQILITLNIYVKPFVSSKHNVRVTDVDMWQMNSKSSQWGVFADAIERLRQRRTLPRGQEKLRDFGDGKNSYYCFEIPAIVNPTKPGPIEFDDVKVVWDYPTKLVRSRSPMSSFFGNSPFDDDFFGGGRRLEVESFKKIVATVEPIDIDVKPIPTMGQPQDYRGAIGNYSIRAFASSQSVSVGEPIELQLQITGDGPLATLSPPPLGDIQAITDAFKVARSPLAGEIDDGVKYFTTTIRPRSTDVTEIPRIPFSFFDPDREEFKTVYSEAIPIEVDPTEELDVAAQFPASRNDEEGQTDTSVPITESDAFADKYNQRTVDAYSSKIGSPNWLLVSILAAATFGLGLLAKLGLSMLGLLSKMTNPAKLAHRQIQSAEEPSELADACIDFVIRTSRGTNIHEQGRREGLQTAAGFLRQNDQYADAAKLESFAQTNYRKNKIEENDRVDAEELLNELKRAVKVRRVKAKQLANFGSLFIGFFITAAAMPNFCDAASSVALGQGDTESVSEEVNPFEEFNSAMDSVAEGDFGTAKIALLRARKLASTESKIALQLLAVKEQLELGEDADTAESFQIANWYLRNFVGDAVCNWGLAVASIVFWGGLLIRVFKSYSGFGWIAGFSGFLLVAFWVSFALTQIDLPASNVAVVTGTDVELRETDSVTASIATSGTLPIGAVVEVLAERSGWVKIEDQQGRSGWAMAELIEIL